MWRQNVVDGNARRRPLRIGVALISRYLAGEQHCAYRLWRMVREPAPEFEISKLEYLVGHAALLHALAAELSTSDLEAEKTVRLCEPPIAGRIDLVEQNPTGTTIWEVKSGKPRGSHLVQTAVYAWLAQALAWTGPIRGAVRYDLETVRLPTTAVDVIREPIRELIRVLLSDEAPVKVKGMECRDCAFFECAFNPRHPTPPTIPSGLNVKNNGTEN